MHRRSPLRLSDSALSSPVASLQLPEFLGAILLPDCTLFPHGALPLHIFEDRYRQMLTDSLEGDCLFCVGRLLRSESPDFASCTAQTGTAGLIRASREKPDGCSDLILHGVCRVRFCEWLPERPYPFARIEPVLNRTLPELEAQQLSRRLRDAVEAILLGFPEQVVKQVEDLLDRAPDPAIMSDAVAQQFVHDSAVRQELLEETDVARRVDTIIDHLHTLRSGGN